MTDPSTNVPTGRRFAFAGLEARLPTSLHLAAVHGCAAAGLLRLGDDEAVRLQLAWLTPQRLRRSPEQYCRRALRRVAGKRRNRPADADLDTLDLPGFATALAWTRPGDGCDCLVAHCDNPPRYLRAHWLDPDGLRETFRHDILPTLRFLPEDQPQPWAFFNLAFTAPAGLLYRESTLHLGDLGVTLADPKDRSRLTVRFIFPADLALKRRPTRDWLIDLADNADRAYRRAKSEPLGEPETAIGPALQADSRLRGSHLTPWRKRRFRRTRLIHHAAGNRLIALDARADKPDLDALLDQAGKGIDPEART